jgi:hypothetical protein
LDHRKSANVEIAIRKLLDDHSGRYGVDIHSAVPIRQIHSQEPEFAHLSQQGPVNPAFPLALLVRRQETLPRKSPGGIPKRTLVFRKDHVRFISRGAHV